MNGVVFQTSTAMIAGREVVGFAIQATGLSRMPSRLTRRSLMTPLSWLYMNARAGGDDGRDGPGDQHRGAHDAAPVEVRIDDQGDRDAEHGLEGDRGDGEGDGVPERADEDIVAEQADVVVEPDVAARDGHCRTARW